MTTIGPPHIFSVQATLKVHGLIPDKRLGQHFISEQSITDIMVAKARIPKDEIVIEIGPGVGTLTRSLLASQATAIIAIESDSRCVEALSSLQLANEKRLRIIHQDAQHLNVNELVSGRCSIVANLPYNIATVLILQWLDQITSYNSITVMIQKEVAQRLAAESNSSVYSRLSVLAQWLCEIEILLEVPPHYFIPPPKVQSTVVKLTPRSPPLYPIDRGKLELVCRAAFIHRRKTLASNLKRFFSNVEPVLYELGIKPYQRAQELSIAEFCLLAQRLSSLGNIR